METNSKDHNHINQLIGQSPSWMLRWGMLLIAGFLIVLAVLSWFIRYPDVITAKTRVHTSTLPVEIKMPIQGQIDSLFIKKNQTVVPNQLLAVLRNPAVYADVLTVEKYIQNWSFSDTSPIPQHLQLGQISSYWTDFIIHQKELEYAIQNNFTALKSQNTERQIAQLENLNQALINQKSTLQEALDFAKLAKDRTTILFEKGASDLPEIEQVTTTYLRAKQLLEQHSNKIIGNQIDIERLKGELLAVDFEQKKGQSSIALQIQKDIQHIQTAITNWKQQYLVYAPIAGTITVLENWTIGQQLNSDFPILSIVPTSNIQQSVVATAYVTDQGFGKIKLNTDVQIQLNAYPYYEFGVLEGTVQTLPTIVENGFYLVKIKLKTPLVTSYGKEITFQPDLQGTARITTKKRRLIERLFDRINNIRNN